MIVHEPRELTEIQKNQGLAKIFVSTLQIGAGNELVLTLHRNVRSTALIHFVHRRTPVRLSLVVKLAAASSLLLCMCWLIVWSG